MAKEKGIKRIAFPSISTGVYGYPLSSAATVAVSAVKEFVNYDPDAFDLIEWVCFDERTLNAYSQVI